MNYKDATPEDIIRMKQENLAHERIPLSEIEKIIYFENLPDGRCRLSCNRCGDFEIVDSALYSFDCLQTFGRKHRDCRKE